ncbi:MAG: hypothetical protein R6U86_00225 [Bacteroidales bacterium]
MKKLVLFLAVAVFIGKQTSVCFATTPSGTDDQVSLLAPDMPPSPPLSNIDFVRSDKHNKNNTLPGKGFSYTVDGVTGPGMDNHLAMAAPRSSREDAKRQTQADIQKRVTPLSKTILIAVMIMMIVIGVLRFKVMAAENDSY